MSLAIECGATSSDVILVGDNGTIQKQLVFGSANYRLMDECKLKVFFQDIREHLLSSQIHNIGIGMPGILDNEDKKFMEKLIRNLWPEVDNVWIGNDLETALASLSNNEHELKVIVIAGTGSCCYGSTGHETGKVGGYGHRIGDRGSAYAISEKALRLSLRQHEHNSPIVETANSAEVFSNLLFAIMNHLEMRTLKQLILWCQSAKKDEVAALAPLVLLMWKQKNEIAKRVIEESIADLSADCICLIEKLLKRQYSKSFIPHEYINRTTDSTREIQGEKILIGLTGSLFSKDNEFAEAFTKRLYSELYLLRVEDVSVKILQNTALGSLKMLNMLKCKTIPTLISIPQSTNVTVDRNEGQKNICNENENHLAEQILPVALGISITEKRNERSMNLDKMELSKSVDLMIFEEQSIFDKITDHKKSIEILIDRVCRAFQNGGRLFYVGAGTSGRLGILDATECPPTFKSPHEWVQGIIAGGFSSVAVAKEGAEDSIIDGMKAIEEKNVNYKDVVVGIAASGRTPFVWGSIYRAKSFNAFVAFLTFNTELRLKVEPDVLIAINLGPEILTGSTRLKCGTATKCILNMVSTLAMVKYGKCFENLMVDLNPANEKLKQRSLRIVLLMASQDQNINEEKAREVLIKNKYDIRKTVKELREPKNDMN